jgi:glucan biosynthesis protein C
MKRIAYELNATTPAAADEVGIRRAKIRALNFDAARNCTMLLTLLAHAAMPYAQRKWQVHDPVGTVHCDNFLMLSGIFKMDMFFLIAGFFSAANLDREGVTRYSKNRLQQLLMPMLVAFCSFQVIEALIKTYWPTANGVGSPFSGQPMTGHLWFMVDTLIFTAVAMTCMQSGSWPDRLLSWMFKWVKGPIELIALSSVVTAGLILAVALLTRFTGMGSDAFELFGVTGLGRLAENFPIFIIGMVIYRSAKLREVMASVHPLWLLPAVLMGGLLKGNLSPDASWAMTQLSLSFFCWLGMLSFLAFWSWLIPASGRLTKWLRDASFTVYLSHHVVVIAMATLLVGVPWPSEIKFVLVAVAALGLSAGFHHGLVKHNASLSWLLNGRRLS